ncbi:unnamed protein product [Rotaria magnacalcarata]
MIDCCNRHVTCTTKTINKLVEHIDNPVQRMTAYMMLYQYERLFDDSCVKGINCTPQYAINTGSHAPLAVHPCRVSHINRQIINEEVKKMLHNEITSPSNSAWASPVVIVKKHDGSSRFCIDSRQLNSIKQKYVYPLPRIDDVLERLNGSHIFSKLDLRSGPDGLWQFNRLPQGLKNSPSVFQRLMNQTLGSLRWDICLAYLDDIVVYSCSFDQHLIDLSKVCQAPNNSNFKLNNNKCSFFQNDISFLGYKISSAGCLPNDDNVRAIIQFPTPTSSKAAHSFLQMVGFYRKFIPRFAQISSPLNKSSAKGYPFIWTDSEQSSFDQLKTMITSPAVLIFPDPVKPYIIRTDASGVGIGVVLLQEQIVNRYNTTSIYKPVAFASRTLKPAETRYSTIELEALDIWWNVTQKFHSYIEGQQFTVETDHKPLLSLMKKTYHNSRIERWMTTLQQYDMIIRHISVQHQTAAPEIQRIKKSRRLHPNYIIDNYNVLFKIVKRKSGQQLHLRYLPASLIVEVLSAYHNSTFCGAHFGVKRAFYKIRDRFYWPNMYKDIVQHISSCINCGKNKPSRRKPDGHLQSIKPPRGVWERLAMDYVGPVPESKSGNKYFLVLTDLFSKFVVTKPVPDNTSTTAARFLLYDVFMIYGVPLEIIADNGSHFTSALYESLIKLVGCCHIKTTPYNPQANGQCERHNATLVPNLIALSNHSRSNWDEKLLPTTYNYNTTRHDSTGYTPFELMFARSPRFMFDFISPPSVPLTTDTYRKTMQQFMEHTLLAARNSNLRHQLKAKQRYDSNRPNPQYYIGQNVIIRNRSLAMNKFSSKFIGPYTNVKQVNNKTYVVQNTKNNQQTPITVQDLRSI